MNLLCKLSAFVDPPICKWIQSFLSNRSIQGVLNGTERLNINTGIPQGTVVYPVLFFIYINDLLALTSDPIHSFADGSTLHHSYKRKPSNGMVDEARKRIMDKTELRLI